MIDGLLGRLTADASLGALLATGLLDETEGEMTPSWEVFDMIATYGGTPHVHRKNGAGWIDDFETSTPGAWGFNIPAGPAPNYTYWFGARGFSNGTLSDDGYSSGPGEDPNGLIATGVSPFGVYDRVLFMEATLYQDGLVTPDANAKVGISLAPATVNVWGASTNPNPLYAVYANLGLGRFELAAGKGGGAAVTTLPLTAVDPWIYNGDGAINPYYRFGVLYHGPGRYIEAYVNGQLGARIDDPNGNVMVLGSKMTGAIGRLFAPCCFGQLGATCAGFSTALWWPRYAILRHYYR